MHLTILQPILNTSCMLQVLATLEKQHLSLLLYFLKKQHVAFLEGRLQVGV